MKMNRFWYRFLYSIVRAGMFFWHPVFRVEGRGRIPEGPCVICSNHVGMADPIWTIFALRQPRFFRIMAKDQLMHLPVLRHLFRWIGMIGVKRGEGDIAAVKTALKALKDGEKLLIYPEGTRVRETRPEAKTGAVMLAQRAGCPLLPLYMQRRRHPFSALHAVIGEPVWVQTAGARPTAEELRRQTDALMDGIYAMGEGLECR